MRQVTMKILCGASLLLAAATVAIWIYVAFYGPQRCMWQGQREYCLVLEMYAYRLDVLSGQQQTFEVHGDIARAAAGSAVAVPMRGVEHYARDGRGHGFYGEFVSWPAECPTRPLPPPVPLAGGGMLKAELSASGVSLGVPFWFVLTLAVLLPPAWLAGPRTWHHLRTSKVRLRAKHGLCLHCGYDLRATPARCPECGTVPG